VRAAVSAELFTDIFAVTIAVVSESAGRVVGAADAGVGFVGEEGLRVAVVPGEGDAEPGCEGGGLGAACLVGVRCQLFWSRGFCIVGRIGRGDRSRTV